MLAALHTGPRPAITTTHQYLAGHRPSIPTRLPATGRTAAKRDGRDAEFEPAPSTAATALGALGVLGAASPARAVDELSSAAASAAEAAAQQAATGPAYDDPVITVLFTVAIAALSVVTLGVRWCCLTSRPAPSLSPPAQLHRPRAA